MEGDEYLVYDATDCDIDTLRNEVISLDKEITDNLHNATPSVAESGLHEIYDAISKKYGLDLQYKDFREFIRGVADQTKLENSMNEALGAKVITSIAQRTQMKLMVSMSYLIDRSLDLIEKESAATQVLTPELVGMIDKTVQWYSTLTQIKDSIHMSDPDRTMDKLIEKEQGINSRATGSQKAANIALIKELANDLKNSENK